MSLSSVLEEIKKVKPIVDEDILSGPRETYAGREGRQRQARDQYRRLRETYIDELRMSATFVIVCGSEKDEFAKYATEEYNCFQVDPEAFYKELANKIPQNIYDQKTPCNNLFDIMTRHFEEQINEMGIIECALPVMKAQYHRTINSKNDFVNVIKEAINDQVGSEIVGIYAIRSLADKAIEGNHESKVTPIVMTTDDERLALDLNNTLKKLNSISFLVSAGKGAKQIKTTEGAFAIKEINSENVKNTLTNIAKLSKNK